MATGAVSTNVPHCIGIIMDGNRRWALAKRQVTLQGHEAGYKKLKEFTGWARDSGVRFLVAYAFSTENWSRSSEEVGYLMKLFRKALSENIDYFINEV